MKQFIYGFDPVLFIGEAQDIGLFHQVLYGVKDVLPIIEINMLGGRQQLFDSILFLLIKRGFQLFHACHEQVDCLKSFGL